MVNGPYEQLQGAEADHDDSSSDVTIPFLDSEDPMHWKEGYEQSPRSKKAKILSVVEKLKPIRWLVEAGLVVAVIVLLVQRQQYHSSAEAHELGGDITGFAPRCKTRCFLSRFIMLTAL